MKALFMTIISSKKFGLRTQEKFFWFAKKQETSTIGAQLLCSKQGTVIGHVPREVSRIFWHYLGHGGTIACEVTGRRKYGKGLEVPCVYKCLDNEKMVDKMRSIMQKPSRIPPSSQ